MSGGLRRIDLERPTDAIAGRVLEDRRDVQVVRAWLPGNIGNKPPGHRVRAHLNRAFHRPSLVGGDVDRALSSNAESRANGKVTTRASRVPAAGTVTRHVLRVEGPLERRAGRELVPVGRREGPPARVPPVRVHDDRVPAPADERASHLAIGQNSALHARRIEQHRVSRSILVPQIHVRAAAMHWGCPRRPRRRDGPSLPRWPATSARKNGRRSEVCSPAIDPVTAGSRKRRRARFPAGAGKLTTASNVPDVRGARQRLVSSLTRYGRPGSKGNVG